MDILLCHTDFVFCTDMQRILDPLKFCKKKTKKLYCLFVHDFVIYLFLKQPVINTLVSREEDVIDYIRIFVCTHVIINIIQYNEINNITLKFIYFL